MDLTKTKPSSNFVDISDPKRNLLSLLLDRWSPEALNWNNEYNRVWDPKKYEPGIKYTWSPEELKRLKAGEDTLNILRDRMRNEFMYKFIRGPDSLQGKHPKYKRRTVSTAYDNY